MGAWRSQRLLRQAEAHRPRGASIASWPGRSGPASSPRSARRARSRVPSHHQTWRGMGAAPRRGGILLSACRSGSRRRRLLRTGRPREMGSLFRALVLTAPCAGRRRLFESVLSTGASGMLIAVPDVMCGVTNYTRAGMCRYSGDVASIVNSTTKPAGASATTPPAQPSANSVSPAVQGLARPSRPAPRRPNTNGERAVPPGAPYGRTDGEVGNHAGGAPSSPDAADAASWEESPPYRHHDAAFAQQLNSLDELLSGGPPPPPSAVESSGGVATPAPPARRAPVPPQSQESQPQTSPPPLLDASTNHAQYVLCA